jgi:hypothetical protein
MTVYLRTYDSTDPIFSVNDGAVPGVVVECREDDNMTAQATTAAIEGRLDRDYEYLSWLEDRTGGDEPDRLAGINYLQGLIHAYQGVLARAPFLLGQLVADLYERDGQIVDDMRADYGEPPSGD